MSDAPLNAWNFVHLRCNSCWELLIKDDMTSPQMCYRTSCCHLFCEKDAYRHFGDGELVCPACQTELSDSPGSICEVSLKKGSDPQKLQHLWSEILSNPTAILLEFQHALDFIFLQLAQESFRQEQMRNAQEEEMKGYQSKYGERYMQLKSYSDKCEADMQELRSKISQLTVSNDELRQAFKEKSRKSRNWEKLYKSMKSQMQGAANHHGVQVHRQLMSPRQHPSPQSISSPKGYGSTGSSSSMNNHQQQSPKFATSLSRPMNHQSGTPRTYSRPSSLPGHRFHPPSSSSAGSGLGSGFSSKSMVHSSASSSSSSMHRRLNRPKTPVPRAKQYPFVGKRPVFDL